ncbi:MAG: hypothetical protein RR623_07590 [Bacilli bacterium]
MLSIQTKDINIETEHKILQEDVENLVQEDIENIFKQVFYMQRKLKTNEKFEVNVNNIVYFINYISYNFNLTLKECIEYAYNEIKDRKGKMVDGLWAKEQENE